jgi:hypothetical protein
MARTRLVTATSVAFTFIGAVLVAHADPDPSVPGTYSLSGFQGSKQSSVSLVVKADGSVTRTATFSDGSSQVLSGMGSFTSPTMLQVTFSSSTVAKLPASKTIGLDGALDEEKGTVSAPSNAGSVTNVAITGTYAFDGKGGVNGRLSNNDPSADWKSAVESGSRKDDSAALKVLAPANGTGVLNGQVLDVKVQPSDADFEVVSGPARKALNSQLQVTGTGDVVLVATKDGKKSDPVTVHTESVEVCALEVQNTQAIDDAPPPHMTRDLGSNKDPVQQPAAILLGQPLVVKVTLKGQLDLGVAAKVTLTGSASGATLTGTGSVSSLKAGDSVVVQTASAFASTIDVHKLQLDWKLAMTGSSVSLSPKTPLHVYTCFKTAIRNGPYYGEPLHPLTIKDHFEKACTWASGASENVGNGDSSIGWKLDNYVRHHVHPVDFKKNNMPFTCAYDWNSKKPPLNYGDLDGASETKSSGERGVGQLYYPPLEVKNPAKEDYSHYAQNFGWWVLDNPNNTGGRCNQQASLMCDLFGTMGISARVHYLQRVGVGKTSGRPVRQYFNSEKQGEYWNFHGLAEATLADGTKWLYDGSFSFAPERKNGLTAWAEAPGRWLNQDTPFIYEFGPWYYEDGMGGTVADSDIPTVHVDSDNPNKGEYSGVPAAKGESLTWYNDVKNPKDY